jgi:hypothetical protein
LALISTESVWLIETPFRFYVRDAVLMSDIGKQ